MDNFILKTDSYKLTHWKMYKAIDYIYSYFECRSGSTYPETTFFGLQYFLKALEKVRITKENIDEAEIVCEKHFGTKEYFNRAMWTHIVENYDGRLPICINAVPEGKSIPINNVLVTLYNTDPKCAPLVTHLETWLMQLWYPSTVATLSREVKKMLKSYLDKTSDDLLPDVHLNIMLHDFGFRGVSSFESSGVGGMAHLVNFYGTDTLSALSFAETYYGAKTTGFSVPASEHSVMTQCGRDEEYEVIKYIIEQYPSGILSLVLDSYNIYNAVTYLGTVLKEIVLERHGKIVVRPDSGNPPTVSLKLLNLLEEYFGCTVNGKGYKVLNPKVGIIYGDGLDPEMINSILKLITEKGYCASNFVFGMGGGLLQLVTRDKQRHAFKCSAICDTSGQWRDVYKDPIEGSGKKSKAGKFKLILKDNKFQTVKEHEFPEYPNELVKVFENGYITKEWTFDEVRQNASIE